MVALPSSLCITAYAPKYANLAGLDRSPTPAAGSPKGPVLDCPSVQLVVVTDKATRIPLTASVALLPQIFRGKELIQLLPGGH